MRGFFIGKNMKNKFTLRPSTPPVLPFLRLRSGQASGRNVLISFDFLLLNFYFLSRALLSNIHL